MMMICDTIDLSWEVVVYKNNNIMPMDVGGRDVVDRYLPKVSTSYLRYLYIFPTLARARASSLVCKSACSWWKQ